MSKYTKNIGVKTEVYDQLEKRKSPGQSFTGVIKEQMIKCEKYKQLKNQIKHQEDFSSEEALQKVENQKIKIEK